MIILLDIIGEIEADTNFLNRVVFSQEVTFHPSIHLHS